MKMNWTIPSAQGLIAAAMLVAGACTNAAETTPPTTPPAPTPLSTKPEETPEQKAAREAREKQQKPFKFEMGERRDPFVFIAKTPDYKQKIDNSGTTLPGQQDDRTKLSDETIAKVKAETEAIYTEAEMTFLEFSKEGKAAEVISKCDEGLKIFAQYPGASSVEPWQVIREKLFDLRKAAERVRLRQDAKRKFEELNIRLTGIVAKERNSQAIVNSRTVRKGDVVAASDNSDVVVDEIRTDQVVFVFQGFKMALNLSDGPK